MSELMFVPVVLFLVIVAPIWLILHYATRNSASKRLTSKDESLIEDVDVGRLVPFSRAARFSLLTIFLSSARSRSLLLFFSLIDTQKYTIFDTSATSVCRVPTSQ